MVKRIPYLAYTKLTSMMFNRLNDWILKIAFIPSRPEIARIDVILYYIILHRIMVDIQGKVFYSLFDSGVLTVPSLIFHPEPRAQIFLFNWDVRPAWPDLVQLVNTENSLLRLPSPSFLTSPISHHPPALPCLPAIQLTKLIKALFRSCHSYWQLHAVILVISY